MKYCIIIIMLSVLYGQAFAQQNEEVSIGLYVPVAVKELNASHLTRIESRLMSILSDNGVSSTCACNGIVLYPVVNLYDQSVIEAGVQNLTSVSIQFSIYVKHIEQGTLFGACSIDLQGSGANKDKAVNMAISAIKPDDAKWKDFIGRVRKEINNYYASACSRIIADAKLHSKTGDYDKAFALLSSIPPGISCYDNARNTILEVYRSYMDKTCKAQLIKVKGLISSNEYRRAISEAILIDPYATCFKEAETMIQRVSKDIDKDDMKLWNLYLEERKRGYELDKARIDAVKEIGKAYWESRRRDLNYNILIK